MFRMFRCKLKQEYKDLIKKESKELLQALFIGVPICLVVVICLVVILSFLGLIMNSIMWYGFGILPEDLVVAGFVFLLFSMIVFLIYLLGKSILNFRISKYFDDC